MNTIESTVEELKRHPAISGLFRSRLRGQMNGSRYRATCPFHPDSSPSLDVYRYQGLYLFKCLGCGAKGNILQFLMRLDGISFPAAMQAVQSYFWNGSQQ